MTGSRGATEPVAAVAAALEHDGWRADGRRREALLTAAHPVGDAVVAVVRVVCTSAPAPGSIAVHHRAGVGVESAMNLAVHLSLPPTAAVYFPSDPDKAPEKDFAFVSSPADAAAWVRSRARTSLATAELFPSPAAVESAMVHNPRLHRFDFVIEQVLLLAARGRDADARALLATQISRIDDDEDRYEISWRATASRLRTSLDAWVRDGSPRPDAWWD